MTTIATVILSSASTTLFNNKLKFLSAEFLSATAWYKYWGIAELSFLVNFQKGKSSDFLHSVLHANDTYSLAIRNSNSSLHVRWLSLQSTYDASDSQGFRHGHAERHSWAPKADRKCSRYEGQSSFFLGHCQISDFRRSVRSIWWHGKARSQAQAASPQCRFSHRNNIHNSLVTLPASTINTEGNSAFPKVLIWVFATTTKICTRGLAPTEAYRC